MAISLDQIPTRELEALQAGDYASVSTEVLEWFQSTQGDAAPAKSEIDVVATTKEGGRVYRLSEGKLGYTSPSYSTTNQDEVKRILDSLGKDGTLQPTDQALQTQRQDVLAQSPAFAKITKATEGTFGAGSYVDEAAQAISPDFGEKTRYVSQAMQKEHPIESELLKAGGAIVSTLPLGLFGALSKIGPAVTRGEKMLRGGGIGLGLGAIEGGVYGYGEGQGEDRLSNAKRGAIFGGGTGLSVGAAAPIVSDMAEAVVKRVKASDVAAIAGEFGISAAAAKYFKAAFANDFNLEDAIKGIREAGEKGMIADSGEAAAALLDAAGASGASATQQARRVVDDRAEEASASMSGVMDQAFGVQPTGYKTAAESIADRTKVPRKEAYNLAYSQPINYADDTGRAIEEVLSRVAAKDMAAAVEEANADMLAMGVKNQQVMATIGDDGRIVFSEMPNVQQLDYIKRALGTAAHDLKDPITGQLPNKGVRLNKLAIELRDAVTGAVPDYGKAVKIGGDKIAEDNASRMGMKLLSPKTTREDVARQMLNASDAEKSAAKLGVRNSIDEAMANVKASIATPDVDVKEAMKILADMSSKANRTKLSLILGPEEVKVMLKELTQIRKALELRAATAKGSATAPRTAIIEETARAGEKGVVGTFAEGDLIGGPMKIVQLLTGSTAAADVARKKEAFSGIITALTEKRGASAEKALRIVKKAMDGQKLTDSQARFVAMVVESQAPAAAVQTGRSLRGEQQ